MKIRKKLSLTLIFPIFFNLISFSVNAVCTEYSRSRVWTCSITPFTGLWVWSDCNFDSRLQETNFCPSHGFDSSGNCDSAFLPSEFFETYEFCDDESDSDDDNSNVCPNIKVKIKGLPFQRINTNLKCTQ